MVAAGGLKGRPGGGRRAEDGGVLQQLQLPPSSPRPSTAPAAAASIDAAAPTTRRPRRWRSRGLALGCVLPPAALVLALVVEPTAGAAYVLPPRLPSRRPPPVASGSSSGGGGATRRPSLASQRAGGTALRSTIPNDDQQHLSGGRHLFELHERLASTPSWRKPEPFPPIVDYLWGIPSLAMHAHSGLVNLTGSVVSGIRGFAAPPPKKQPLPDATAATATATAVGASTTHEEDMLAYGNGEEDDAFFNPLQAYDDLAELVIWDDTSLYTPPPGQPELADNPWEEDAPVIAQLQHEVAQLLSSASSARVAGGPPLPPTSDDEKDEEKHATAKKKKQPPHHVDTAGAAPAVGGAAGAAASAASAAPKPRSGSTVPRPLLRKALRRVRVGAALLLHAATLCLAAVASGPHRRLLAVGRALGNLLRALIASLALLGTACSTFLRRLLAPPARALPRPDLFQRLTTTFTRFLHANYPWLLSHPILYGRPFPWQWKGWTPQPPPSFALGPTIPGLPTLSALLRDLGDVVTPHSLVRRRRRHRRKEQQEGEQERYRHHAPHWTLPQQGMHLRDDWSKSILRLDGAVGSTSSTTTTTLASPFPFAPAGAPHPPMPPPPSIQLDEELMNSVFAAPPEVTDYAAPGVKGREERFLEKEVRRMQQRSQDAAAVGTAAAAAAADPVMGAAGVADGMDAGGSLPPGGDAGGEGGKMRKGPEVFTSYFPQELEGEEGPAPAAQQQQPQQQEGTILDEIAAAAASARGESASTSSGGTQDMMTASSAATARSAATFEATAEAAAVPDASPAERISSVFSAATRQQQGAGQGQVQGQGTQQQQGKAAAAAARREAMQEKMKAVDEANAAQDSAYNRLLAEMTTEPMPVTEENVADAPPGLPFAMPWVASAPSLEQMDKRMVALAVDSARTVRSKTQLWRYIEEVGVSPLLAALKKNLGAPATAPDAGEKEGEEREDGAGASGGIGGGFGAAVGAGSVNVGAVADAVIDSGVLRTEAVEAILHLMNVAMDLRVLRAAVEGPGLIPVVGKDVVSDLIDLVEEPLLLFMPKIIRPRNEEMLYRGQRAAVEVLYQLVLASDRAIQLIQEDGRLWNALQQMTAEGMYAPTSPTFATCNKLLAAIGHNEWRPKQPGQRGLRILSFDGGGTRGVLSVALLKQVMERVGKDVFETFDVICGTSTGGILAVLFGIEKAKLAEAEALYDRLVAKIFASSPLIQTTKLLLKQSYYDEVVWEQVLQEMLGDNLMLDSMGQGPASPKVFVASLSMKTNPSSLFLWRNYAYGPDQKQRYRGSFRIMVRDALRATTAAPTFFVPLQREDAKYCDGAFLANNPTAVALNEVRTLYPGVPVECVVSIGTGYHEDTRKADGSYGWEGIVNDLINCATNTEVVHETLSAFLPRSKYYRFNPKTEAFALDEVRPERLQKMKRIAREYFWEAENKGRMNQLVDLLRKGGSPLPGFRSTLRSD